VEYLRRCRWQCVSNNHEGERDNVMAKEVFFIQFLTGMANVPPMIMKFAMPVSLSPTLSRREAPLLNPLPQAGEEANEKSSLQSLRARERTNRYASFTLKLLLVSLVIASLYGCNQPQAVQPFKSTNVTGIDSGKDFKLTDHLGKPRTLSDFKGKIVMLFFGYTRCPEACPNTLMELALVMKRLGPDADKVQVLFITLDPERDTQALLAQYVPAFNPKFIGLYGTPAQIAETAKEYHLFYSKEPGNSPDNYTLNHSVGTYIYDQSGRLRLHAAYGQGVDALVHDIKLLLN